MTATASSAWQRWRPARESPWDLRRVAHLHRRAGFAATWSELQRDVKDGPDAAVDRMLSGHARTDGVPEDFDRMARAIGEAAAGSDNVNRLKAWWLYRMLFTPDPLAEWLALMWHNHFATAFRKVNDLGLMKGQNELFREFGRGRFAELLTRLVRHPALLVWLDADSNRRGRPNENLARELMELFTLGVGHFTETDVKEAARALTGWTVVGGRFRDVPEYHDDGEKSLLGQTGRFHGDDVLRIVCGHPATARRLAGRLCELFLGEPGDPAGRTGPLYGAEAVDELAEGLRRRDLDIGWAVETILRSKAFFSDANIGNRVLGPAEFIVGSVRALEVFDPPPSTLVLAEWTATLGQDLFDPPNVFGWEGGRGWITTRTMIARARFAAELAEGRLRHPAAPPDLIGLVRRHADARTLPGAERFVNRLLFGRDRPADAGQSEETPGGEQSLTAGSVRRAVVEALSSPEAHLG